MFRPIEETLLQPKPVVDCEIHQRTGTIAGVCYRDADGTFWSQTFQDSTGEDAEFAAGLHAKHIAARNGLPNDGRVVRVRFVEVTP
jgi:hypothetical protein